MLTNADAQRSQYIHRLNVIRKELLDAQVGHDLKKRVIGYYEYLVSLNTSSHNIYCTYCTIYTPCSGERIEVRVSMSL